MCIADAACSYGLTARMGQRAWFVLPEHVFHPSRVAAPVMGADRQSATSAIDKRLTTEENIGSHVPVRYRVWLGHLSGERLLWPESA